MPRTCRRTGTPCAPAPSRECARGRSAAAPGARRGRAVRRTAARRPGHAERQREPPTRRAHAVVADVARAVSARDPGAQPLPRTGGRGAATGAGGLPTRHGLAPSRVWASNGSNAGDAAVLQASAGAGPVALSARSHLLDVPRVRAATPPPAACRARADDFTVTRSGVENLTLPCSPPVRVLASTQHPHRHRPVAGDRPLGTGRGSGVVVVDEAYAEFRRPAPRARCRCWRAGTVWS
jgi:histidinol-phosphate aminotransferase